MTKATEFCPIFERPPVIETRVCVQFKPLTGVRAIHFGLFWQECLGADKWVVVDDASLLPHEVERFDSTKLNPPVEDLGEVDSLALRSIFRSRDERSTIHFQPDKIVLSSDRQGQPRPSYADLRGQFDPLFERLTEFARRSGFGDVRPDLWEVAYTNVIPKGELWQTPADWHRVLPGLFPPGGVKAQDHEWATFEGEWYFVMPHQTGRVRVKVSKAVANSSGEIVLLVNVRARGPFGDGIAWTWGEGLDFGHQSAVRVFYDIVSADARASWGYQS
jgi:hypothetical protein